MNLKYILLVTITLFAIPSLFTIYIEWDTISNFSTLLAKYESNTGHFRSFISSPMFKIAITFTLSCLSVYKIFEYFSNFNPERAFLDALVPAVVLFLAFNWMNVLGLRNCFG